MKTRGAMSASDHTARPKPVKGWAAEPATRCDARLNENPHPSPCPRFASVFWRLNLGRGRFGPVHRTFPRLPEMPTASSLRRRVESGFFPVQRQKNAFAGKILVAVSGVKGLG